MNEEDSTVIEFTHDGTTIDQQQSHFENGVLFPDGTIAWGREASIRGYAIPADNVPTEQDQGKLQDQHALNLKALGLVPTESMRLRFVRRAVVVSHGEPEEIPEWL